MFFLLSAEHYEAEALKQLLPAVEFQPAIKTIQAISEVTEDKVMYDQREKADRDYEWAMASSLRKGELIGQIRMAQSVLHLPQSETNELKGRPTEELERVLAELQTKLRTRGQQG